MHQLLIKILSVPSREIRCFIMVHCFVTFKIGDMQPPSCYRQYMYLSHCFVMFVCLSVCAIKLMSHHKTKPTIWHVHLAKTQISLGTCQCDQCSLCAQWIAKDPRLLHANCEDWSDWADAQADQSSLGTQVFLLVLFQMSLLNKVMRLRGIPTHGICNFFL